LQIIGQIFTFNGGTYTLIQGKPLNSGPWNSAPKKLEESLYHMVLIYWQMIILFCHNPRVWQTDRLTNIDSKSSPLKQLDVH